MNSSKELKEISQVNKEKKKIAMGLTLIKSEFNESIDELNGEVKDFVQGVNSDVKDFLIHKVAIPVGVIGLGWYVLKKVTADKPVVQIQKKQMEEIKSSSSKAKVYVKPTSTTSTKKNATPTQTTPYNSVRTNPIAAIQKPSAVKKIVIKESNTSKLKRWLPIAIQLAKTGYTYYKNHYVEPINSNHNTAVADNFLRPKTHDGNPYDRIPEMIKN